MMYTSLFTVIFTPLHLQRYVVNVTGLKLAKADFYFLRRLYFLTTYMYISYSADLLVLTVFTYIRNVDLDVFK